MELRKKGEKHEDSPRRLVLNLEGDWGLWGVVRVAVVGKRMG
jgi:hypothetical protein